MIYFLQWLELVYTTQMIVSKQINKKNWHQFILVNGILETFEVLTLLQLSTQAIYKGDPQKSDQTKLVGPKQECF